MLAELAAFNAAFATVKATVSAGADLSRCVKQIGAIVGAKSDLQARANKKKNGFLAKLRGQDSDDFEEFMALEVMIWAGRPGLWHDWQRFQAEARKERQRQQEEAKRLKEQWIEYFFIGLVVLLILGALVGFVVYVKFLQGST
jgi:hypothetical protein